MDRITLAQLRVLDAVVAEGSLQAAALRLGRTHPTLHSSLSKLETQIGFAIFDRDGYRMRLTPAGEAFLARVRRMLREADEVQSYATQLASGQESELRIVIGDLSPLPATLGLLRGFFAARPATRLHLSFEALAGPWELLLGDRADLILHHVDQADPRFETLSLHRIRLIPVAAPDFLPLEPKQASYETLRDFVQCVIRDTAQSGASRSYYLIDGAPTCTVSDQFLKKEVILQGLGWGHMPDFLVEDEMKNGRLVSLANAHLPGGEIELVAARRANRAHGPVATALWEELSSTRAPAFRPLPPATNSQ